MEFGDGLCLSVGAALGTMTWEGQASVGEAFWGPDLGRP